MARHAQPGWPSIRKTEVYEPLEIAKERSRFLAAVRYRPEEAYKVALRGRTGSTVRSHADRLRFVIALASHGPITVQHFGGTITARPASH